MKNIFKKNHIIITALAIMIVIAGYLSFSNKDTPEDTSDIETMNPDTEVLDEFTEVDGMDVATNTTGTTTPAPTNAAGATVSPAAANNTGDLGMNDISDEELLDVTDNGELNIEDGVPGEAVLANASIDGSYFISSKIKREQVRASNKETLMGIIESPDISEEDKQAAIESMIQLTENAEKEGAAEILLEAKGFDGSIVYIVDGEAEVVVNAANLTDQQLAIIEEVVKSKTDIAVEHISINPVVVEE
jgi:stage III sporulation protein AH